MKRLFISLGFVFVSANMLYAADDMHITVEAGEFGVFQKNLFQEGALMFLDRTYRASAIPEAFDGYEFLMARGNVKQEKATIIPSENGIIYLLATQNTTALDASWSKVENSDFSYSSGYFSIYQRAVSKGERIALPELNTFQGASPIAKSITLYAPANETPVRVEAQRNAFSLRKLQTGVQLLNNRGKYTLDRIPAEFEGFDFLANGGGIVESGTIIPQEDGLVYIIAKAGLSIAGWDDLYASFIYDDGADTQLSIYKKTVSKGERVSIPELSDFRGFSPLAFRIVYNEPVLKVEGELLDIRESFVGAMVFPQNSQLVFPSAFPESLQGKCHAVGLIENPGVRRVSSDSDCTVRIAVHYNNLNKTGWMATGESFQVNTAITYFVYSYDYSVSEGWIDIPQAQTQEDAATLVFADQIEWVDPLPIPGTVITKTLAPKEVSITNPSLVILPEGDYLASCSGAFRYAGEAARGSFFLSSDKGKTWKAQSKNTIQTNFSNLFVHNGTLYYMGPKGGYNGMVIRASADKGVTWTEPDENSGTLLTDNCHTAPVPVLEHNGRIWRAVESVDEKGENRQAFVMSAPAASNLMDPSNWTVTNSLPFKRTWFNILDIGSHSYSSLQWIEGNVVADREGNVVNILRVDETKYGKTAAMTHVSGIAQLSFDDKTDFIEFPGGGKKFTIRYDAVSDRYWTLSNVLFDEDQGKTHYGISKYGYKYSLHGGLYRNRLALMYSDNLREWTVKDTLISSDNPFFNGFQYVDWQFEGEDIIAVSRTAFEGEDGLPLRQHDANYLTFHRFEKFRGEESSTTLSTPPFSALWVVASERGIEVKGLGSRAPYCIEVWDMTGRSMLSKRRTDATILPFNKKGVFFVKVRQDIHTVIQKIIIK